MFYRLIRLCVHKSQIFFLKVVLYLYSFLCIFQKDESFIILSSGSFGVMLSRMYLGVHSPADIVCGGVVGVIVLSLWIQVR